jgi:hypothetical protein
MATLASQVREYFHADSYWRSLVAVTDISKTTDETDVDTVRVQTVVVSAQPPFIH